MAVGLWALEITGCGPAGPSNHEKSPSADSVPGMTRVAGNAIFGSQCPYGTFPDPRPVPLTLWECPIGMHTVELTESLQPLILQADCKKRTMDVRGTNRSHPSNAWEIMPDGTFFFSVDGGSARLKADSSGRQNCSVPLSADLWGKVECDNRDQAKIKVETIWRAIKYAPEPLASNTPVAGTSGSGPRPNGGWMARVIEDRAEGGPSPRPSPAVQDLNQCNLPSTCYFHTITQVDQCY